MEIHWTSVLLVWSFLFPVSLGLAFVRIYYQRSWGVSCSVQVWECGCVGVLILPQLWEGCHHSRGDLSIVTVAEMSPKFPLRLWWQHCFLNSCRNLADPWSCLVSVALRWFCSVKSWKFFPLSGRKSQRDSPSGTGRKKGNGFKLPEGKLRFDMWKEFLAVRVVLLQTIIPHQAMCETGH